MTAAHVAHAVAAVDADDRIDLTAEQADVCLRRVLPVLEVLAPGVPWYRRVWAALRSAYALVEAVREYLEEEGRG